MAQVYRSVGGRKLTKIIAMHRTVQTRLTAEALEAATKAEAVLAAHRHDGHARIEVEQGNVDRYVVLDDTRGLSAALSIEFGRSGDADGKGAMAPVAPLRRGLGLSRGDE